MDIPLAILFGAMIGLLLGLVGGGGSILTVPILVYLLGEGVHDATATALVIVGVTAVVGLAPHARGGRVATGTALVFGGAGIGGAFAGAFLNELVSGPVILLLFGGLMLVVAGRMYLARNPAPRSAYELVPRALDWRALACGLGVGVLTGFFGVGGGFLIVPALVLVLGFPMRLAVGTSLAIIAINSAAGVVAHLGSGGIDLRLAFLFIVGGFVGATVGGRLAGRVDEARLSRGFAVLVGLIGVFLIARNSIEVF